MGEMPTIKDQVRHMIDTLPDDCTLEDVQYHLYVIQKIQSGLRSLEEEGGVPHEEVKRRLSKWLTA